MTYIYLHTNYDSLLCDRTFTFHKCVSFMYFSILLMLLPGMCDFQINVQRHVGSPVKQKIVYPQILQIWQKFLLQGLQRLEEKSVQVTTR